MTRYSPGKTEHHEGSQEYRCELCNSWRPAGDRAKRPCSVCHRGCRECEAGMFGMLEACDLCDAPLCRLCAPKLICESCTAERQKLDAAYQEAVQRRVDKENWGNRRRTA